MTPTKTDQDPITRVHERLDELFGQLAKVDKTVTAIAERCVPCQQAIQKHESTLYGNGQAGLVTRIATVEAGKTDTLSIKGIIAIITAVGTLAATIGGAMAALVK